MHPAHAARIVHARTRGWYLRSDLTEEDLTQILLLHSVKAHLRYPPPTFSDSFRERRAWWDTLHEYRTLTHYRSAHFTFPLPLPDDDPPIPDDVEDVVANADLVRRLLRRASPRERRLLALLADGHTQRHAAHTLGVSEARVSQILTRLRTHAA